MNEKKPMPTRRGPRPGTVQRPPEPPDDHHTLRSAELAGLIDRAPNTVRKLAVDGVIPAVKYRKRYWFNYFDVTAALRARTRTRTRTRKTHVYEPPDPHHTLRTSQVAEALGCHCDTVKDWARQGLVPSVMHQGWHWFNLDDTRETLAREGKLATNQAPVQPTAPYRQHTLTVKRAAALVGISANRLTLLATKGLVPYVISEEHWRMFNHDDLLATVRSNPSLLHLPRGRKVQPPEGSLPVRAST